MIFVPLIFSFRIKEHIFFLVNFPYFKFSSFGYRLPLLPLNIFISKGLAVKVIFLVLHSLHVLNMHISFFTQQTVSFVMYSRLSVTIMLAFFNAFAINCVLAQSLHKHVFLSKKLHPK